MWKVVGNKRIIQFLKDQIKKDSISQAYLFVGPASLGKFTTALFFAQTLLCLSEEKKRDQNFCQTCSSCQSFEKNIHPDFTIIENTNTPLSIETIRELKRQIVLLPSLSKRKVIIFEEASYLTLEAQNALLKTLEEPPKYAVLILVSQKENLLPTILSRCSRFYFQPVSLKEIKTELKKRGIEEDEASLLSHLSLGRIGQVLEDSLFQQKWEESFNLLFLLSSASILKEKIDLAKNLRQKDLVYWTIILRDALLFKINYSHLSYYPSPYLDKLSQLCQIFSLSQIHFLIKRLQKTQELLQTTQVNQKLLLENLVLQL